MRQKVRFLHVTKHVDMESWKEEPFDMMLPVKCIKQIRVFERYGKFNVEAYTSSDYAYYVWTTGDTRDEADESLGCLADYLNGECE